MEFLNDPAILILGIPKRIKYRYSITCICTGTLFIVAKGWKQPKCQSAKEWINKMTYCLITKCNEVLLYSVTYVNLKNKEASHKIPHIVRFHLYESQKRQINKVRKSIGGGLELKEGERVR